MSNNDIVQLEEDMKPLVLIVDDIPENLQVLGAVLYQAGYEVAMADNGSLAIQMVSDMEPDLILLDIMMPEMDGYEVCERLKQNPEICNIPIIFLTAKHETENIVKGFKTGAVDYITKPFNSSELLARVSTHVDLVRSKKKILKYNEELKVLLEKKDEFLGIAVHDMKNPINNILGFSNLVIGEVDELPDELKDQKDMIKEDLSTIKDSSNFMLKVITELLNTETLESGKISLKKIECDTGKIIDNVLVTNKLAADAKQIKIHTNNFKGYRAEVDEDRFREIADNLVSNAVKYSPRGKNIYISLSNLNKDGDNYLRFSVKDQGPGLTEDDKAKVFGRFTKLSARPTAGESSSGLGLSIVKKLAELHGGDVRVESKEGEGAEFIFEMPNGLVNSGKYDYAQLEYNIFEQDVKKRKEESEESEEKFDADIDLNDLTKSRINDLILLLSNEYMQLWENVRKNNIVNDIRKFALEIREIGKEYQLTPLEEFGEDLNTKAITFDIEGLPKILSFYPKIVDKLKKYV